MKKVKLKQGTLEWEKARESRIGSSEVFDIVKYYASDEELWNCGINADDFKSEAPYTTVWALYHKLKNDGLYHREALAPEFAEYGHAAEPYGVYTLQKGRVNKVVSGDVYIDDNLIVSLDASGIAEECDVRPYDVGEGKPKVGQRFVCEQKTMRPDKIKNGLPFKYIIQAQYQVLKTKADFFIIQLMVLNEDTPFNRGKICQMSKKKRFEYFDDNMTVSHYYFKNNPHLARLIEVCLDRFFDDVKYGIEPMPFIDYDSQKNIIESIRLNALYDDSKKEEFDLSEFEKLKAQEDVAILKRKAEQQRIVEFCKLKNVCKVYSPSGAKGTFIKTGALRISYAKQEGGVAT